MTRASEYQHLREDGLTLQQIADRFGVTRQAVSKAILALGGHRPSRATGARAVTQARNNAIAAAIRAGGDRREVARRFGVPPTLTYRLVPLAGAKPDGG